MVSRWYYRDGGEIGGPVSRSGLVRLLVGGRLRPSALVRQGEKGEWVRAETVPELTGSSTPSVPGPVPPKRHRKDQPAFDPYTQWLGVPSSRRPPSHYDLVGVPEDERDARNIEQTAALRMQQVRARAIGEHGEHATQILNELSEAVDCLVDPARRAAYDEQRLCQTIDGWLATDAEPADFYGLLDAPLFTVDREFLLRRIDQGTRRLQDQRSFGQGDPARIERLLNELARARAALSSPEAYREYHAAVLRRLRSAQMERGPDAGSAGRMKTLQAWLEGEHHVHPERSWAVTEAIADSDPEQWDRLLAQWGPPSQESLDGAPEVSAQVDAGAMPGPTRPGPTLEPVDAWPLPASTAGLPEKTDIGENGLGKTWQRLRRPSVMIAGLALGLLGAIAVLSASLGLPLADGPDDVESARKTRYAEAIQCMDAATPDYRAALDLLQETFRTSPEAAGIEKEYSLAALCRAHLRDWAALHADYRQARVRWKPASEAAPGNDSIGERLDEVWRVAYSLGGRQREAVVQGLCELENGLGPDYSPPLPPPETWDAFLDRFMVFDGEVHAVFADASADSDARRFEAYLEEGVSGVGEQIAASRGECGTAGPARVEGRRVLPLSRDAPNQALPRPRFRLDDEAVLVHCSRLRPTGYAPGGEADVRLARLLQRPPKRGAPVRFSGHAKAIGAYAIDAESGEQAIQVLVSPEAERYAIVERDADTDTLFEVSDLTRWSRVAVEGEVIHSDLNELRVHASSVFPMAGESVQFEGVVESIASGASSGAGSGNGERFRVGLHRRPEVALEVHRSPSADAPLPEVGSGVQVAGKLVSAVSNPWMVEGRWKVTRPAKPQAPPEEDGQKQPEKTKPDPKPSIEPPEPSGVQTLLTRDWKSPIEVLAWGPSNYLAVGGGQAVDILDLGTGQPAQACGELGLVADLAWYWSQPGNEDSLRGLLAVGSLGPGALKPKDNRNLIVYQLRPGGGEPEEYFESKLVAGVTSLAWSPGQRTLAVGVPSGEVLVYRAVSGPRARGYHVGFVGFDRVEAVAWNPTNRGSLAVAERYGQVWICDMNAPDAQRLKFGRVNTGNPGFWNIVGANVRIRTLLQSNALARVHRRPNQCACCDLAWSPDGSCLAVAEFGIGLWQFDPRRGLTLRRPQLEGMEVPDEESPEEEPPDAQERQDNGPQPPEADEPVPASQGLFTCLAWHPEGKLLAGGTLKGEVFVFKYPEGDRIYQLATSGAVNSLDWSRSSERLAAGSEGGQLTVWQFAGEPASALPRPAAPQSEPGRTSASGSADSRSSLKIILERTGLRLDVRQAKLRVLRVMDGTPARRGRFKLGDVILRVNQTPISSLDELRALMESTTRLRFEVRRNGETEDLLMILD